MGSSTQIAVRDNDFGAFVPAQEEPAGLAGERFTCELFHSSGGIRRQPHRELDSSAPHVDGSIVASVLQTVSTNDGGEVISVNNPMTVRAA